MRHASFPKAILLIGSKEWEAISNPKPPEGANVKPFESWIKGESKVEPQPIDKDVFGDGTVIMLRTPGHTPGHSSLLVKLAQMGPVILSGDAVHFRENYDSDGVPAFNYDRAQTVTSIERIKKIASNGDGRYPTRCTRHRKIARPGRRCSLIKRWESPQPVLNLAAAAPPSVISKCNSIQELSRIDIGVRQQRSTARLRPNETGQIAGKAIP